MEGKECQPRGFSGCVTRGSDLPRGRAVPDITSRASVQLGIYPNISWELWEGERGEMQQAPSALSFPRVGDFGSDPRSRSSPSSHPSRRWMWPWIRDRARQTTLVMGRMGFRGMGEREFTTGHVDRGSLLSCGCRHCSALKSRQREDDESISTSDQSRGPGYQPAHLWLPKQLSCVEERLCNPTPGLWEWGDGSIPAGIAPSGCSALFGWMGPAGCRWNPSTSPFQP